MSKTNLLNFALLFVVASLAAFIYFSEETNYQLDRLSDVDANNFSLNTVTKIKIKHNKNTTTIIKQEDGNWRITQPVAIAANKFRLDSLLELINAPIHSQYTLSDVDSRALGLNDSQTSIQFDDQIITFGITNPGTKLRYLQLNDTVYTIEDVYYPLISSHFSSLVSLNLLPANSTIEKLILSNQTISKDSNNFWHSNINTNTDADISADNINKTIDHWQNSQAFGIHQYLKRGNLGEVFIYLREKKKPITYTITDTEPWLILARPELGLEYHLDVDMFDKLISPH